MSVLVVEPSKDLRMFPNEHFERSHPRRKEKQQLDFTAMSEPATESSQLRPGSSWAFKISTTRRKRKEKRKKRKKEEEEEEEEKNEDRILLWLYKLDFTATSTQPYAASILE